MSFDGNYYDACKRITELGAELAAAKKDAYDISKWAGDVQVRNDKLESANTVLNNALVIISNGTVDDAPPFRGIDADMMRRLAHKAIAEAGIAPETRDDAETLLRMVAAHLKCPQLGGMSQEQESAILEWYDA